MTSQGDRAGVGVFLASVGSGTVYTVMPIFVQMKLNLIKSSIEAEKNS